MHAEKYDETNRLIGKQGRMYIICHNVINYCALLKLCPDTIDRYYNYCLYIATLLTEWRKSIIFNGTKRGLGKIRERTEKEHK